MTDLKQELFPGAQRRAGYDERAPGEPPAQDPGRGSGGSGTVSGAVVSPGTELAPFRVPASQDTPAGWWRALLARAGVAKAPLSEAELADRENERIIRQATWTRAVNVIVANRKGGSGKTPATIITAGVLASIRGGYVAAWEAAEAPGDLADRAEGEPARGLTELLAASGMVTSAGNLAGYTAPQTSHAAVVGTVSARAELRPVDVHMVRDLLDAFYHVTVTDTGNNDQSATFLAALDTADAVLIPCTPSLQSLRGAARAMATISGTARGPHLRGIRSRAVVVLSHDGGPEDKDLAETAADTLRAAFGPRAVVEVPYDPAIRRDGEITLASLSPASARAWREVARHLVEAMQEAPEDSPILTHPSRARYVNQSNTAPVPGPMMPGPSRAAETRDDTPANHVNRTTAQKGSN